MQHAGQNYNVRQKQLICLGLIAIHESVTASKLISFLGFKETDALRSWLHPLIQVLQGIGTSVYLLAKSIMNKE